MKKFIITGLIVVLFMFFVGASPTSEKSADVFVPTSTMPEIPPPVLTQWAFEKTSSPTPLPTSTLNIPPSVTARPTELSMPAKTMTAQALTVYPSQTPTVVKPPTLAVTDVPTEVPMPVRTMTAQAMSTAVRMEYLRSLVPYDLNVRIWCAGGLPKIIQVEGKITITCP